MEKTTISVQELSAQMGIHDLVKRYTEVPELTAEIIREFIEKVYVYHPEKINGQKTQRVRIV